MYFRRGLRMPGAFRRAGRSAPAPGGVSESPTFVAIDFETADHGSDSACAVALVRVEGMQVTRRELRLIRPPRQRFLFTYLHGIAWEDVEDQPSFEETWPTLGRVLEGAQFLAAHNASFDRNVLDSCCRMAGLRPPDLPFLCTVRLTRKIWGERHNRLPQVCARLGIPLDHHNPLSDAEACARIVRMALADNFLDGRESAASLAGCFVGGATGPVRGDGGAVRSTRA